jgi:tetratricopeptide (TPR) repeat protein
MVSGTACQLFSRFSTAEVVIRFGPMHWERLGRPRFEWRKMMVLTLVLSTLPLHAVEGAKNSEAVQKWQDPDELADQALAAQKHGQYQVARDLYARLLTIRPDVVEIRANLGLMDHLLGKYVEAVANLQTALAEMPSLTNAATVLGIDLIKLHRPTEALKYLKRNCGPTRSVAEACLAMGEALVMTGEYLAATESYNRVLSKDSSNSEARYALGITYLAIYRAAVDQIAKQPHSIYLRNLAELQTPPTASTVSDRQDISALWEAAHKEESTEAWYTLALRARQLTIDSLMTAYHYDPDSPKAHILLAQAAGAQSREEEARRQYRTVLNKNPDDGGANIGMASLYLRAFQMEAALPLLDKVLRVRPRDLQANYLKGQILVLQGQYEDALPYINIAIEGDLYLKTRAWALLGKIYKAQGRWSEAIDALQRARPGDRSGSIEYQLYQLYQKVGNSDAAAAALAASTASRTREKEVERTALLKNIDSALHDATQH